MALTIAIEGKGLVATADAISDASGGTWSEQGGGTISVSNDVFLIGPQCIGGKYASKSGFHQYDIGAGNELDFTAGTGTEDGQLLYIWVSMTALGTLDTLANFGLCIRLSSDAVGTANYIDFLVAGNDDKNGWTGGFKCFVIDPTMLPSRLNGTQASIIASIRTMGVWIDCSTSARADSIFVDQIMVGSGLRITGTSTVGWTDVVDYCTDYQNPTTPRGWAMFQEREGVFYAYGQAIVGDAVSQIADVSFKDTGATIQFGISEYYESGAWKSSYDRSRNALIIEDHATYKTTFTDGVIVGTEAGRSGSTFLGSDQQDVSADLYGGNNALSVTSLYGTKFKGLTGTLNSGDDADHKFLSVTFEGCGQFDPVGAPVIRNCSFIAFADDGVADASKNSALLWNASIDIADCDFLANSHASSDIAAGIEYPLAGTFPHVGINCAGNEVDIYFSALTGDLVINKDNNSNASTSTNDSTGTVTIQASSTWKITISNEAGTLLEGVNCRFEELGGALIANGLTDASGIFTYSDSGANRTINIVTRKIGYKGPSFKVPTVGDFSIPRTLSRDTTVNII